MNLRQYHDEVWWPSCEGRLRECTLSQYSFQCAKYIIPKFGERELDDITTLDIEKWMGEFERCGSAKMAYSVLKVILRHALKHGMVGRDASRGVDLPRSPKKRRQEVLDDDGIRSYIEAFKGHELEPYVLVSLSLGLRPEEACALEWSDIDMASGRVVIDKGVQMVKGEEVIRPPKTPSSNRVLKLPPTILERMRELSGEGRLTGGMTRKEVFFKYKGACREMGLKYVPPKNMRHSYASSQVRNGVPVKVVSKLLGHSDVSVTLKHYCVMSEGDMEDAQDRFDRMLGNRSSRNDDILVMLNAICDKLGIDVEQG